MTRQGIELFDLSGRAAVITGGSKGLGKSIALGLASAGARVVVASRHGPEAEAAAQDIAARYGVEAIGTIADVGDGDQVEALMRTAIDRWGRLDVLVNNAGINIRGPIDQLTYEQFRQVQDTNVDGVWRCCRAAVGYMKQARSGRIINVASTLGLVGLSNRTAYASSKGAVVQMTRALALELADFGITCNAICPGPFLTDMNTPIAETQEGKQFIVGATALQRWGRLEEIQGAAMYLASDAASYTTGSMLVVDGGWTAR